MDMDEKDFANFKKRLSKVNELRRLFWAELRAVRNDLLSKYPGKDFKDDPQWQTIMCFLNDMFESTIREEFRREMNLPRQDQPHRSRPPCGLYAGDKLCVICGSPLIGRQKSFCSKSCRNVNKSRRYRQKNPDKYRESQLKYSQFCVSETAKEKKNK